MTPLFRSNDIFLTELPSSGLWVYDFRRFKAAHELLRKHKQKHAIGIVASEIANYPDLKQYIKDRPQEFTFALQGWTRGDYARWPRENIMRSLKMATEQVSDAFGYHPEWLFIPWDKRSPALDDACEDMGMKIDASDLRPAAWLEGERGEAVSFHYWWPSETEALEQCFQKKIFRSAH